MAMHNYAKNHIFEVTACGKTSTCVMSRDPYRGNPVTQDRVVRGSGPSRGTTPF